MWSTPEMTPLAMAGAAPRTTTKVMAVSESLNSSTASGSQAMVGMVCRPVIIDPTPARRIRLRDTARPTATPMTTEMPYPTTARWSVLPAAWTSTCDPAAVWVSTMPCQTFFRTAAGPGRT